MAHDNNIPKYNHNGGINEVWAYYDSLKYDNDRDSSYQSHNDNHRHIINRQDVEDIVDGIIELIKLYR